MRSKVRESDLTLGSPACFISGATTPSKSEGLKDLLQECIKWEVSSWGREILKAAALSTCGPQPEVNHTIFFFQ